ncbi:thiamine phosphate synthase [Pelagicoccus sp. SDUM812002]|uniref:thiamine phosphate synthase n=1 Tax=Pelagicoccus sp. SDUM812002 TaxID=3041266 RepID=UPI00281005BA|nr:thiamine phosphate synthase [Pelagicoccus sp. SDUM812002]MDQ8184767.1 thiamine phosphate synthase [Pelagicoccus sp. SDUM812002]
MAVSPETVYEDEASVIERLFEAGLSRYHIRKPRHSVDKVTALLDGLPAVCRRRVVLHQHKELVEPYQLGGYHIKDTTTALSERGAWRADAAPTGTTVSRSLHRICELDTDCHDWDYVFISPVFNSISKSGYAAGWPVDILEKSLSARYANNATKRYALGGLHAGNFEQCLRMGFDGVVLHGALWRTSDPLAAFNDFQKIFV